MKRAYFMTVIAGVYTDEPHMNRHT